MGGVNQAVCDQEIERTIDCRLGDALHFASYSLINFTGRKVSPCMMEDMQDRHPLGCHSKATRTQLGSVNGSTGHRGSLLQLFAITTYIVGPGSKILTRPDIP